MGRNLPRNKRLRWRGLIACALLLAATIGSAVVDDRWAVFHVLPHADKWLRLAVVPLAILLLLVAIWTGRVWWRVPNAGRVASRRRAVAKWTGLPITLALAFAWIGSVFWYAGWSRPMLSRGFSIIAGSLDVYTWPGAEDAVTTFYAPGGWFFRASEFDWDFVWLPQAERAYGGGWNATIPIWIPLLMIGTPTLLAWYRDRPAPPPGVCFQCGYDLRGNVSGRCPECGQDI